MKTFTTLCLALLTGSFSAFAQNNIGKKIQVIIENPWLIEKTDEPVVIDLHTLKTDFTVKSAFVSDGTSEVPSQLDDMNGDTRADELAFVINMPAKSKKTLTVTLSPQKSDKEYPARVYAEMLFRTSKKNKYTKGYAIYADGNANTYNIQHHHGVAFESELVAYRIYFNEKQTTDLYGKFHKGLEIEESHDDSTRSHPWATDSCRRTYTYCSRCRSKRLAIPRQRIEHDKPLYPVCRTP